MPTAADLCELIDSLSREDGGFVSLSTGHALYEAAARARLVKPGADGQGCVAAWFGELVSDGRTACTSRAVGQRGIPAGVPWTDAEFQQHYGFRLTADGRDDARETRRLRRGRDTDVLLDRTIGEDALAGLGATAHASLNAHLQDLRTGLDSSDGPRVIGAAKELIEAAAKIVLEAADQSMPRTATTAQLYRAALAAAGHAEPAPTGFAIARSAAGLVAGVNDLRNEVGVGHGGTSPRDAAMPDARLAARVSVAAVLFLLDDRVTRIES